jgi:hypothetical protein
VSTPISSHTIPNPDIEIPILPSIVPESSPIPIVVRCLSISNVVAPSISINALSISQEAFRAIPRPPQVISSLPRVVPSLPIVGINKR